MVFPEEMSGVKGPVTVLALVCPEPQHGQQAPVIVGTNAFLFHRLLDIAKETGSQHKVHSMRLQAVYKQIQTQKNLPQRTAEEESIRQVRWHGPGPLFIAPGEKVYANCKVEKHSLSSNNIILIDNPVIQQLPDGVMIQPGVLPDTSIDANHFTVLLLNETQKPTSIQVGTVLAEIQLPIVPVYEVKPECGPGSVKTLHRDHLLPIGYLVRMPHSAAKATKNTEPSVTRSQTIRKRQKNPQPESADSGPSDSESEFDEIPGCQSFDIDEVGRHVLSTYRQSNQISKSTDENMDVTRSGESDADLPDESDADLLEQSDADLPDVISHLMMQILKTQEMKQRQNRN
ncbi:hypothetical protein N1851_013277 [Merluccius polli]|uniref:Uncharacterized protein n=1 Tax=Merluccius polli TaxID=89951 RepID=A0AA47P4G4_MERPO|nr:hypothetical protein N1851_013277 [Merluccius polli]